MNNVEEAVDKEIVVQNRRTKAYLCDGNKWSGSPGLARRFETPYHALYTCVDQELEHADVVFRFPDDREVLFLHC
jgi:hypothetical protein